MSDFTVEVRRICEMSIGLKEGAGFSQVENVIQAAIPFIFDFDFPIFDETYRNVLETKILRHFYMREIGYETIGRWKLALSDRLNVVMPYYNQLYKSELLEFNPLYDVDVTRDHTTEGDGNRTTNGNTSETESYKETTAGTTSETESYKETTAGTTNTTTKGTSENQQTSSGTESTTSNTESINKYLDTPQGSITDLTNSDWLTNLSQVNGNSTVEGESSGTVTDNGSTTGKSDTTQSSTRENTGKSDTTQSSTRENTGGKSGSSSGTETFKNTENYLEHVTGKQGGGTFSEMLIAYRKTFLNIDSMVLNELEDLFMLLW